jgi:hypothetical protein
MAAQTLYPLLLKSFQKLGYFIRLAEIPTPSAEIVERARAGCIDAQIKRRGSFQKSAAP